MALRLAILESSPDFLGVATPEGRYLYINPAGLRLTGCAPDELIRSETTVRDFQPDLPPEAMEQAAREGVWLGEATLRRTDGSTLPVSQRIAAVKDDAGRVTAYTTIARDVSARKQAERDLRESRRMLQLVLDTIPARVFWKDRDLKFLGCNRIFATDAGASSPAEMVGRDDFDFGWREQAELYRADDRDVIESGRPKIGYEEPQSAPDGRRIWLRTSKIPLREESGAVIGVMGTYEDITQQKAAEAGLEYRLAFEKLITAISTRFINLRPEEIDAGVTEALRAVGRFMDVDRSYVFLFRGNGAWMDNTHEWCADGVEAHVDRLRGLPVADFRSVADEVLRGRVARVRVAELGLDRAVEKAEFEREGIRSLVLVPMSCRGEILGFLGLDSVREEREFLDDGIALLRIVGECLASALERKRYEETLRRERDFLNRVMETSPAGIVRLDREGRITFANARAERVLGVARGEILGRAYQELSWKVAEDEGSPFASEHLPFARVKATGRSVHDSRHSIQYADGRLALLSINAAPIEDEKGEIDGVVATVEDVTEREIAERALREMTEELNRFFSLVLDMLCISDSSGRFLRLNRAWEEVLGYPIEEMEGRLSLDFVHEDDRRATQEAIESLSHGRNVLNLVNRYRRKDGTYRWLEWRSFPYADRLVYSAARDITDRVETEDRLRRSESRYRFYMDNLQGIAYQVQIGMYRPRFFHGAVAEITGYEAADFLEERVRWDLMIHPEDLPRVVREAQRLLLEPDYVADNEYRIVRRDGSVRWVRDIGQNATTDPSGPSILNGLVWDVTDRRQAEETLRSSEARLRSLFRASPVGIGLVADRVLLQVNDRVCEMTGYTEQELLGQSARMLYPTTEDYEFVGREKYDQIQKLGVGTVETRWLRKDGRVLDVLLSSVPLDSSNLSAGLTFTALDITERKLAMKGLARAQALLTAAIENSPAGILIADAPDACIRVANSAASLIWGMPAEVLTNVPLARHLESWKMFHPDGRPCDAEDTPLSRAVRDGETSRNVEMVLRWPDGTERWVLASAAPVHDAEGLVVAGISVFPDITEIKIAEQEHRRLQEQVQHVQKLESLGVLAGGIAHDFNNLLMAILGNADLALRAIPSASPAQGNLRDIETASRRAADLCRQMLAYSGKGRFVVEAIDLNEVVREMIRMLEVSISKKTALEFQLKPGLPAVEADATQIRQVLMNLITNASEAIGSESGVISVSTGDLHCDRAYLAEAFPAGDREEGTYVYFEVSDTGCGMTPYVRSRIFDPFFTTKFAGRGLGMAAVLGIVRGHRGAIRIAARPERGTAIRVLLPAAERTVARAKETPKRTGDWRGTGTVLIVDDEQAVRDVAAKMLAAIGFGVVAASDGREAVEKFRESQGEIACVLLDLTMPQMDGEETYRELHRVDESVRVILTSGYNEQEVTRRFVGLGLAGFLQKPFHLEALRSKLREVLER